MKLVYFMIISLLSLNALADSNFNRVKDPKVMSDIRRTLDMKIFHDRVYVKKMMKALYDQDKAGVTSDPSLMSEMGHEGIFSDKDAAIIRGEAAHKVSRTQLIQIPWDKHAEAIEKDPFAAFTGLIEKQEVPKLKKEELDNLNSVDKKVIPQTVQMMTESGPDVGASTANIFYAGDDFK